MPQTSLGYSLSMALEIKITHRMDYKMAAYGQLFDKLLERNHIPWANKDMVHSGLSDKGEVKVQNIGMLEPHVVYGYGVFPDIHGLVRGYRVIGASIRDAPTA